jgi:sarcosine oxidase subunit beta
VHAVLGELLPRLAGTELPTVVSGEYDSTPDAQPIVGAVGPDDGLYVAAGFSGHGFMLAPAVGQRIAGSVLGSEPDDALTQLSLDRFDQGSLHRELETV